MDTNDGFFPEREVLRARRLRAMVEKPVDPSEARTRRTEMWFVLSVAIFLPMFVNTIVFGWHGHITPRALAVLMYVLSFLLVGCVGCVAVVLWRRFNARSL
jgi:hypothetical protein